MSWVRKCIDGVISTYISIKCYVDGFEPIVKDNIVLRKTLIC